MKITLSNLAKVNSNSSVIKEIEKQCTFANPKFLEALKQRRSVHGIDRQINLSTVNDDGAINIPIGMVSEIIHQYQPEIDDQRRTVAANIPFSGELRDYQSRFVNDAYHAGGGVMVAATGSGKTVSAIALTAKLQQRCLILVKSLALAQQWQGAIQKFTGLECGLIGGGKSAEGGQFTVATVQTLVKLDLSQFCYGMVIADECHNAPASQFFTVINGLDCRYKYGLSATPQRRDGLEMMIFAALGPIVAKVEQSEVEGAVLPVVVKIIKFDFVGQPKTWNDFLTTLANNQERNQLIVNSAIKSSRVIGTVVLTGTIEHAQNLAEMAAEHGADPVLLHGQLPAKQKAVAMAKAETSNLIIGTLSLLSEGIDWPHVGGVIFAAPVSAQINKQTPSATRLIQSIGRARRPFPGKSKAYVMDISDNHFYGLSAARKRGVIYKQQGFSVFSNQNGVK